ncbi:MAG: proline--tRNA ligase, partial [Candidatus Nealsonbacteria bacterium]|nr:proline--tRNA ligase [Candidatus Nealsonbacteria bacterium]
MRQSQLFAKIKKEAPKDAEVISHKFLVRGDFIEQSSGGIWRFLPLGWQVHKKIENIIRQEMFALGAQEIFLPALQNKNLWLETGRWQTIDPPLFKLKDRHQKETALGSTHEEEITDIARKRINSWQDLPFALFQIQNKFRNEMRTSGGLLRTKEFIMKDLYSFHLDEKDLQCFYDKVQNAYKRIFAKCGLKIIVVKATGGTIGGKKTDEFMVASDVGEDRIALCPKCGFAANIEALGDSKICPECKNELRFISSIELGHTFNLGTKYSQAMGANFRGKDGKLMPVIMGCYGIGLGRLIGTIAELNHDDRGIIWPKEISPFSIHLIGIGESPKVRKTAEKIYQDG